MSTPRVKKSKPRHLRTKVSVKESLVVVNMADHFFAQVNPRRKQEIMDSRMIQEDPHAIANLSPHVINRRFNASRFMESLGRCDERSEVGGGHHGEESY
jgi:hypothetical protein